MIEEKIEAVLFFTGEAIELEDLRDFLAVDEDQIAEALKNLKEKYKAPSGIVLCQYGNKIIFQTNPSYYDFLVSFFDISKNKDLTKAALEVLSIIAYKQPVTKSQIDDIRGVKSDNIIRKLVEEDFIYVSSTLDAPGRPNLYSTTSTFLRRFSLDTIDDLPKVEYEEN